MVVDYKQPAPSSLTTRLCDQRSQGQTDYLAVLLKGMIVRSAGAEGSLQLHFSHALVIVRLLCFPAGLERAMQSGLQPFAQHLGSADLCARHCVSETA